MEKAPQTKRDIDKMFREEQKRVVEQKKLNTREKLQSLNGGCEYA